MRWLAWRGRLLLGWIAVAFGYLLIHAREPLRLSIGDPWSDANVLSSINYVRQYGFLKTSFTDILDVGPLTADSYRYIHYPPLAEITYGAIARYLGVSDIGTLRLFAIAFSALAMWLLYHYARRIYSDSVALIATAMFTTSLLWMMYADSIHQAPVMQASCFLALWGLVRATESGLRRHYAAAVLGSFACFFTSYDGWLFLPAGVLFTVYIKRGNPFQRGNRHFVVLCAVGCMFGILAKCLAVIGAVGWQDFVADLRLQFFERATSKHDPQFNNAALPTLVRRWTLVFTPLVWITIAVHAWKALRAPSIVAAVKDTAVWMLIAAALFLYVFAQLAASQMLASQVLLPFYAIGTALVIDGLLCGGRRRRWLATGWLIAAPLWSFGFMVRQPRAVIAPDDVARVNAYMATHDRNDFVMSNVLSDGHVQAPFQRHYQGTFVAGDPLSANLQAFGELELMGADYLHAVIFTTPESRFIDKSLWPLAMPRRRWAITGWPMVFRAKAYSLIEDYDTQVMKNLDWLGAEKVLALDNFNLYRIDRDRVIEFLGRRVPVTSKIDFGSIESSKHKLLGWGGPAFDTDETPTAASVGVSTITGYFRCLRGAGSGSTSPVPNRCKTVLTSTGIIVKGVHDAAQAKMMIRVERACDLRLTFAFARPALLGLWMNDFEAYPPAATEISLVVPRASVRSGINIITIEDRMGWIMRMLAIRSLVIEPLCSGDGMDRPT
jgi:Dolichyl-phosphate-mannose-protein mannosyltransferase